MSETKGAFYCAFCNYNADNHYKFSRHIESDKHQIAKYGVTCCGLTYFSKHKWVNHKKSPKHQFNIKRDKIETRINKPDQPELLGSYQLKDENLDQDKKEKYEEMMLEKMLRFGETDDINEFLES